jgi:hypothetical protein
MKARSASSDLYLLVLFDFIVGPVLWRYGELKFEFSYNLRANL